MRKESKSSWESASRWYDELVGKEGQHYHKTLIFPQLVKLMGLEEGDALIDLACGQGVLSRWLDPEVLYTGIDISPTLVKAAKKQCTRNNHSFLVGDVCQPLPIDRRNYTHATIILALQNLEKPRDAIKNAAQHMKKGGQLFLVVNHPCFRIPRQSFWEVDKQKKVQYRRVEKYMSSMEIPIQTNPVKGEKSKKTYSYHHSLTEITSWLRNEGFVIENLEEWCSNKESQGGAAKMENRARLEFPLFLFLQARWRG